MPRPKNVVPVIEKTVSLPEDVVAAVDLELFSEVEGKVPFGAWKGFLTRVVKTHLAHLGKCQELNQALEAAASSQCGQQRELMMRAMIKYLADTGAHKAASIATTLEAQL